MEKTVTVKKNINQRYGIRFLACLYVLVSLPIFYLWNFSLPIFSILALPGIPLLGMLIYFEIWHITLGPKQITSIVCFRKIGPYTYAQVSSVVKGHSSTMNTYIKITFRDGKTIQFRTEDENAEKAIVILTKHHSIRLIQ